MVSWSLDARPVASDSTTDATSLRGDFDRRIIVWRRERSQRYGAVGGTGNGGERAGRTCGPFVGNALTPPSNWVSSGAVMVAVSKSGKTLYGYSTHTGTWDKTHVENPIKEFVPIVQGEVAVLVVGKRAYAFGGKTGRWDSIELAEIPETSFPIIGGNVTCIVVGKRVYAFSGIAGRWDTEDLAGTKGPIVPVMDGQDRVQVEIGTKIWMFSGETGRWAVADLSIDTD
jgi:uncharacterized cupin superfamily protein